MAGRKHTLLSTDVKITAYLKFRRIYEDAVKARRESRPLEGALVLGRALLHVPALLAAGRDEPIPELRDLPEWLQGCGDGRRKLFERALCIPSLEERFRAAEELGGLLTRWIPQPGPVWESGRMRFGRGFTTDTLFFGESNLRLLRWWDSRRDRGELRGGIERLVELLGARGATDQRRLPDMLLEAFADTPGLSGILIFGSGAAKSADWRGEDGSDIDLAFMGRGLWFRRAFCDKQGVRLDILRIPELILKRGVEAEEDLIHNALFTARVIRDDTGGCRALQQLVQSRYRAGKTRCRGEMRNRLENEMGEWAQWARPHGEEPGDRMRLEAALSRVLKLGFRLGGRWFPPDQEILAALAGWRPDAAQRLRGYVRAEGSEEASRSLLSLAEAFLRADAPLSDRARRSQTAPDSQARKDSPSGGTAGPGSMEPSARKAGVRL